MEVAVLSAKHSVIMYTFMAKPKIHLLSHAERSGPYKFVMQPLRVVGEMIG